MKNVLVLLFFTFIATISINAQEQIKISTEKVIIDGSKYYLHTVEQGQTLYSISKAYNVSANDIEKANEIATTISIGQVIKIPILSDNKSNKENIISHIVAQGETFYSLCVKYNTTQEEVLGLNKRLKSDKPLKIGQEIKFPNNPSIEQKVEIVKDTLRFHYHLVEKGETIYKLTKLYDVTKEEIVSSNPEFNGSILSIGNYIKIPKKISDKETMDVILTDSSDNINPDTTTIEINDTTKFYNDLTEPIFKDLFSINSGNKIKDSKLIISVLLPFDISANNKYTYTQERNNQTLSLLPITELIMDFYAGLLTGIESVGNLGINIELRVFDIGNDTTKIVELIQNGKIDDSDIIFGPAFRSQVHYLNKNIKNNNTLIVLPFIKDANLLKSYSNNFILQVSNISKYENIANFAKQNPSNKYFVIQGEKETYEYEYNMNKKYLIEALGSESLVKTIKYDGKDLLDLDNLLCDTSENIVILPFNTETSVMQVFTELFQQKKKEITLIGDKSIVDYRNIDPLFYSDLKFTYPSCININYNDSLTQVMVSKYRAEFLCEPREYAFLAYDAVNYFVRMFAEYGKNFVKDVNQNIIYEGLSGNIQYQSEYNFSKNSYRNNIVYLYSLDEDYKFKLIYPKENNSEATIPSTE